MKRFWDKVEKTETCWNWKAGSRGNGYGCIKYKGKVVDAHRFVWFLTYGVFPTLWILHACDNRACVNPSHLQEGTPFDNYMDLVQRGKPGIKIAQDMNRSKTVCRNGHRFTADNTVIRFRDGKKERRCLACRRIQARDRMRIVRRDASMVKQQTRTA